MSKSTKILLSLCMVAFIGACAKKTEVVAADPAVSTEPVFQGKYGS